tara:strand:+ start:396 stop:737 length:342 start_codon:yes stop_codon:yes gene_type:complete
MVINLICILFEPSREGNMNGTLSVDTSKRTKKNNNGYIGRGGKVVINATKTPRRIPQQQFTDGKLKRPPVTLVKTWLWMYREAKEYELRECARKNILRTFDSVEDAASYVLNN